MRLGQLSRKLEVTTSDIVNYLSENGIEVKDHPNIKLDEDAEEKVIRAFSTEKSTILEMESPQPELSDQLKETTPAELAKMVTPETEKIPEPSSGEVEDAPSGDSDTVELEFRDPEKTEEIEVIKAPKIKLQGLKVVGKIELPEPKAKEKEEPKKQEEEPKEVDPNNVHIVRHSYKNQRKKLTEEEREARRIRNKKAKQRREAQALARRKEQEAEQLRQKKQKYYLEKIRKEQSVPKKTKKKKKKNQNSEAEMRGPKPKTLLGKFWRWLNT